MLSSITVDLAPLLQVKISVHDAADSIDAVSGQITLSVSLQMQTRKDKYCC